MSLKDAALPGDSPAASPDATTRQHSLLTWFRHQDRGVLAILALFLLLLPLANPRIYATDEVQYYSYLRSLYFDGDLNFENEYREFARLNPNSGIEALLQPNRLRSTGLYGNVAPVGSALMWSPAFLLADGLVRLANLLGASIPANGYSWPYIYAVCYASALYGLAGLLLSYRLAKRYASLFGATLASIAIWLSTPLIFYMFVQMPMSHATGMFLTALFLTIWHDTRHERSWKSWVMLGLVGGLMTMSREQLALLMIVPAAEALGSYWAILRGRDWTGFAKLFGKHLLFLITFLLSLTPQLAAYQVLNGSPRPAGEVSGKLMWCSPHFIDTLIDYDPRPSSFCPIANDPSVAFRPFAHGALIWSPILIPALLGLILLWRRDRSLTLLLTLAFLAQTYINGAFGTTWHLTGAFGFRRLIELTPVFVLGLALVVDWLATNRARRWTLSGVALLFIIWNLALMLNWAVFNDKTQLRRQGMLWPELFRWQLEVPAEIVGKLDALLFDRCELVENCR